MLLTQILYCIMMLLANTVTGVMLKSRNLHRGMNKVVFTHCTASNGLMQETLDEVELSLFQRVSPNPL